MKQRYLEVTYRHGSPLAAYLYLPRMPEDAAARTEEVAAGLLVDYAADGRPIGIEITRPGATPAARINAVLTSLAQPPMEEADLIPLLLTAA